MLNKRIAVVRKNLGYNQKEMAEKLGTVQTTLSNWETGRANPEIDTLIKIAELGSVSLDWLLTGEDRTYNPRVIDSSKISLDIKEAPGKWYKVVAKVTAGPQQVFEDNVSGEVFMPYENGHNCFSVQVEGDSMNGGKYPIMAGDFVLVDPMQTALPGDIIVIIYEGRQMVKKFGRAESDQIELCSFNPEFPVMYAQKDLIEKLLRVVYHQPQGRKI